MTRSALFVLAITALLTPALATNVLAWGAAFEDVVFDSAVHALPSADLRQLVDEASGWGAASAWDDGWTGEADVDAADRVGAALDAFQTALLGEDRPAQARALKRLVRESANLWQPMHAAGVIDPAGARPGFHFRYETLLAAQVDRAPLELGHPRVVQDARMLAAARAADRARRLNSLTHAEERALLESGDRFDRSYFGTLWNELGDDLEHSAAEAAQLVADLIYTAWVGAGSPGMPGTAPSNNGVLVRAVGPNPIRANADLRLDLRQAGEITVDLYDVSGRFVRRVAEQWLAAGEHVLALGGFDVDRPASGVYFLRVESAAGMDWRKVTLLY